MKKYKYRGYTFFATNTFTEAEVNRMGMIRRELRPVYHIEDLKDACARPFLTSLQQCKDFIDMSLYNANKEG